MQGASAQETNLSDEDQSLKRSQAVNMSKAQLLKQLEAAEREEQVER